MHSELDPKGLEAAIKAMWGVGGLEGRAVTLRLSQAQEVAKHVLNAYLEASTQSTGGSEAVGYVTQAALDAMRDAKPGWHYHVFAKDQSDPKATIPLYTSPPGGLEAVAKAREIAQRVRQIVQDVWDKKPGYTDRQAWSDLHGQAMRLLEWDVRCGFASTSPPGGSEAASAEQILQFMRERGVTKITWGEIAGVAEPDSIDLHAYRVAHLPYPDAAPFDDAFLGDGESVHVLPGEAPPEGIAARDAVIEEWPDLPMTDAELLRIRNECEGKDGQIKIWAKALQMIVDHVRAIRALRSPVSSKGAENE